MVPADLSALSAARKQYRELIFLSMNKKKYIKVMVLIMALLVISLWAGDFFKIDRCLDGGGSWNKLKKNCEKK